MDRANRTKIFADGACDHFTSLDLPWCYGMIKRGVGSQSIAEKASAAVFYLLRHNSSLFQQNELLFFKTCRFAIHSIRNTAPIPSELLQTHLSPKLHHLWLQIEPILDSTLSLLNASDHRILLLRFYKSLPINEMGAILNLSPVQVHQSILLALEQLIHLFAQQQVRIEIEPLLTLLLTEVRLAPSRRLELLVENVILQNEPDVQVLTIARQTSKAMTSAAHRLLNRLNMAPLS